MEKVIIRATKKYGEERLLQLFNLEKVNFTGTAPGYTATQQAIDFSAGVWDGIKGLPGGAWEAVKTVGEGYRGLGYLPTGNIDGYVSKSSLTPDALAKGIYENSPVGILSAMADKNYRGAGNRFTGVAAGMAGSMALPYLKTVPGLRFDVGAASRSVMSDVGGTAATIIKRQLEKFGANSSSVVGGRAAAVEHAGGAQVYATGPQVYAPDLGHVTGKGAAVGNRAVDSIVKEDFPNLNLTYTPEYNPFLRTGIAQEGTGTQIGKTNFSSRDSLRDVIVHEELHHRWWERGIYDHHPVGTVKETRFYDTIDRYKRMRGWNE